jgi:hypothetical protein
LEQTSAHSGGGTLCSEDADDLDMMAGADELHGERVFRTRGPELSNEVSTEIRKKIVFDRYCGCLSDASMKHKRHVGGPAFWKKLKELLPGVEEYKSGPK